MYLSDVSTTLDFMGILVQKRNFPSTYFLFSDEMFEQIHWICIINRLWQFKTLHRVSHKLQIFFLYKLFSESYELLKLLKYWKLN